MLFFSSEQLPIASLRHSKRSRHHGGSTQEGHAAALILQGLHEGAVNRATTGLGRLRLLSSYSGPQELHLATCVLRLRAVGPFLRAVAIVEYHRMYHKLQYKYYAIYVYIAWTLNVAKIQVVSVVDVPSS